MGPQAAISFPNRDWGQIVVKARQKQMKKKEQSVVPICALILDERVTTCLLRTAEYISAIRLFDERDCFEGASACCRAVCAGLISASAAEAVFVLEIKTTSGLEAQFGTANQTARLRFAESAAENWR
jgi:hypothetical protein